MADPKSEIQVLKMMSEMDAWSDDKLQAAVSIIQIIQRRRSAAKQRDFHEAVAEAERRAGKPAPA